MLDKEDLQAIAQLISESETRMKAYVDSNSENLKAYVDESNQNLAQGLKSYIDEKAKEATSHAIAYAEGAIIPKFDLLADGHALTQQQIAGLKKDIDRIDYQLGQHEGKFFLMEQAK